MPLGDVLCLNGNSFAKALTTVSSEDTVRKLLGMFTAMLVSVAAAGCGGGGDTDASVGNPPPQTATGSLTLALTDGPMRSVEELVLHVEYLELRHSNGQVVRVEPHGGPGDIDLAALTNGRLHDLLDRSAVPAGEYHGLMIGVDPERSHVGFADGSQHPMRFGDAAGLNIPSPFTVHRDEHAEFVLDVDLGQSLHQHSGGGGHGGPGGGMGDFYEFHSVVHMIGAGSSGGLAGSIDSSLVDINHPDCDPAAGGNWAYLFAGTAGEPDDIAEVEEDGRDGPIVTDRVELHDATGEYRYHFAFLEPGSYRVAFTCSGEWDEAGDNDYPEDPDGEFGFQAFSDPVEVIAGQMTVRDINP